MSPKVSQSYIDGKRRTILAAAAPVFIRKGFAATTMQDIVDACGISRGGLYLFFPSTEEIFVAMLESDSADESDALAALMAAGRGAMEILRAFVEEQNASLLDIGSTLIPCTYEFFIRMKDKPEFRALLQRRREAACARLSSVLEYGAGRGEFCSKGTQGLPEFIVNYLEGLVVSSIAADVRKESLEELTGMLMVFIWHRLQP